jgi:hypothetical protein
MKIPTKTQQSNRTTPRLTSPLARAAAAGLGGLGRALRGGLLGGTLGGKMTTTTMMTTQTLIGEWNASHPAPKTNDRDNDDDGGTTSLMTTTMTAMARGTNCHAEEGKDCATTRATMDQGIVRTIDFGGGKENVALGKINQRWASAGEGASALSRRTITHCFLRQFERRKILKKYIPWP